LEKKSTFTERTAAAAGGGSGWLNTSPFGCASSVEELVLHLPVVGKPGGRHVHVRKRSPVDAACGVEAVGEPRVGVVSLALRRIVPEAPGGNGERGRQEEERGDEPDAAAPDAQPPPLRNGSAGEGCWRLHPEGHPDGRNEGAIRPSQTVARSFAPD
jgi:hypothetical protein